MRFIAMVKANNGKSLQNGQLSNTNCVLDVNADGAVNLVDVALTKSKFNNSAP